MKDLETPEEPTYRPVPELPTGMIAKELHVIAVELKKMNNEFLLYDRITKIQQVIRRYGEENFYVSFSGGKDSTVLHYLIDEAIPGNKIPRVYANTGIEYNYVVDFVKSLMVSDQRIVIIEPSVPIIPMLQQEGYPFKSKFHSMILDIYQRKGFTRTVNVYLKKEPAKSGKYVIGNHSCPKILMHQFEPNYNLRVSDKCCDRLKKDNLHKWQKDNQKPYAIIGLISEEGGRRESAQCLAFNGDKLTSFQPLAPISKAFEDWYINKRNIKLCKLYYEPFNFQRTGCKGCPYALELQKELDVMEELLPTEAKQCEIIWKPVYDEYRRLGYRLRPGQIPGQMNIEEYLKEMNGGNT